jgi:hypothetical protein
MSWSSCRPYIAAILDARGYTAWGDGFATDNIPANLLDRAYHVGIRHLGGLKQNQSDQESEATITLTTFYKGYGDPQAAIDTAIAENQAIMQDCVKPSNRTLTPGLLNVVFDEANIDPIGESNDNAVMVTATYTMRIIVAV